MRVLTILTIILRVNWIKTLYFNLHYFKLKQAIKLPVFVYRKTLFKSVHGQVIIHGGLRTGMLRIGIPKIGIQDRRYSRTIYANDGLIEIFDIASFGQGCRICIGKDGRLILGANFRCTGDTSFFCYKNITFGQNCLLSWDIQLMDTDFHIIRDHIAVR